MCRDTFGDRRIRRSICGSASTPRLSALSGTADPPPQVRRFGREEREALAGVPVGLLALGHLAAAGGEALYTRQPPLAMRRSAESAHHQLKIVDGNLAIEEDKLVPKVTWAVVDGMTAIKWAWVLIQIGSEKKAVVAYIDWWVIKARLRSHQLDAVDAASHRLASEMRVRRGVADHHGRQPDGGQGPAQAATEPPGHGSVSDQDWDADWHGRRWTKDDREVDIIQGVLVSIRRDGVVLQSTPARIQ